MASRWRKFLEGICGYQQAVRPAGKRRSSTSSLRLEVLEDRTVPSTFVVTNANDAGAGSLRQAILDSDAAAGTNRIVFQISGPTVINLQSALPTITESVTIDGTTQPGFEGQPVVVLNGTQAGAGANGLTIAADHTQIKGLEIDNFQGNGILINGPAANHTAVVGDQILNNGLIGVSIVNSAYNVIGTCHQADVISANNGDGVWITGAASVHNQVMNDFIGTTSDGSSALGNGGNGVEIDQGASSNTVSGSVISGNSGTGVYIHDAGTSKNDVRANYIGTNAASATDMGNGTNGVAIGFGASNNGVFGGNVIGCNTGTGVYLFGAGTTCNTVSGNFLGTDRTGTIALGNTLRGVDIRDGANGNTIGGSDCDDRNLIAFNGDYGVLVDNASQNAILSNSIYANGVAGIGLFDGANNNQAAPVLTSAVVSRSQTTLNGSVADANSWVHLQVFKDGPNGQVLVYSGWAHSNKNGTFHLRLHGVAAGDVLTATATVGQNTSEFAAEITVAG
jgi:hypothetical protein